MISSSAPSFPFSWSRSDSAVKPEMSSPRSDASSTRARSPGAVESQRAARRGIYGPKPEAVAMLIVTQYDGFRGAPRVGFAPVAKVVGEHELGPVREEEPEHD